MKLRWRLFIAVILLVEVTAGGMWMLLALRLRDEMWRNSLEEVRETAIVVAAFTTWMRHIQQGVTALNTHHLEVQAQLGARLVELGRTQPGEAPDGPGALDEEAERWDKTEFWLRSPKGEVLWGMPPSSARPSASAPLGDGTATVHVATAPDLLPHMDTSGGLEEAMSQLVKSGKAKAILVFDAKGRIQADVALASRDVEPTEWERQAVAAALRDGEDREEKIDGTLHMVTVVAAGDTTIGAVVLRQSLNLHPEFGDRVWRSILALNLVIALLALLAVRFGSLWMTRPVALLAEAARDMTRLAYRPERIAAVAARSDELGELARVFDTMAAEVIDRDRKLEAAVAERTRELAAANADLMAAKQVMEADLEAAKIVQTALLPASFPEIPFVSGHALMVPDKAVGGDFYDLFQLPDGRIGFLVADVSGKGPAAALFMVLAKSLLHAACAHGTASPAEALALANRLLCEQNLSSRYVTVFYGILDGAAGTLRYAAGGHHPPLLVARDGRVEALPRAKGKVLGAFPKARFEERVISLRAATTLVLCSDGVEEAFSADGSQFGSERLAATLAELAADPVADIVNGLADRVRAFVGNAGRGDDLTVLAIRWTPEPPATFTWTFDPERGALMTLAGDIAEHCRLHGIDEDTTREVNLIVEEIAANAIEHGTALTPPVTRVTVAMEIREADARIVIEDDGAPFDPTTRPPPDLSAPIAERPAGGLGVFYVRALTTAFSYERTAEGNRVTLDRPLTPMLTRRV